MSNLFYVPIIKTSEAEIKAVENLTEEIKDEITPLFELTRSRKSKKVPEGDIYRRLEKLKEVYGTRPFILDLTGEPNLTNDQIESLHNNDSGYKTWIQFLTEIQEEYPDIIPVIQISDEGVDTRREFYSRIKKQVLSLDRQFKIIAYRFPLEYKFYKEDLDEICEQTSSKKIYCIIDAGYITQEKHPIFSEKAIQVISELNQYAMGEIILAGTSFPRNPIEHGDDEEGQYHLEEWLMYLKVSKRESKLIYGDYATINPIRNLQAGGRGWVPRIDLPTETMIHYRRSRRREYESKYNSAYIRVAKKIKEMNEYDEVRDSFDECWGIEQIELASEGYPQSLHPSFWISVRMNIHMTQRYILF